MSQTEVIKHNPFKIIISLEQWLIRSSLLNLFHEYANELIIFEDNSLLDNYLKNNKNLANIIIILDYKDFQKYQKLLSKYITNYLVISIISDRDLNSNINNEFYIRINDTKDEIIETLLRAISELNNNNSSRANNVLSSREIDIIRYIAKGMSSKQIADTLYISLNTVNTHRKNISTKIGIKTASGQTAYAILNNIISIEESTPNFPHH